MQVTFEWSVERSQFVLTFGYCGSNLSANPQIFTARHLEEEFNKHQSLPYIVQVLLTGLFYRVWESWGKQQLKIPNRRSWILWHVPGLEEEFLDRLPRPLC